MNLQIRKKKKKKPRGISNPKPCCIRNGGERQGWSNRRGDLVAATVDKAEKVKGPKKVAGLRIKPSFSLGGGQRWEVGRSHEQSLV